MKAFYITLALFLFSFEGSALEKDDHKHSGEAKQLHRPSASHDDEHDQGKTHKGHDDHEEDDDSEGHKDEHDHDHESEARFGLGKAIQEVKEGKGFKLSKEAFKTLELGFHELRSSGTNGSFQIPEAALVTTKNITGVYRFREDFFKFIPVSLRGNSDNLFNARTDELMAGDRIVVEGVGIITLTDVFSTDSSEYGHGH